MAKLIERQVGSGITARRETRNSIDPNAPGGAAELKTAFEALNLRKAQPWGANASVLAAVRAEDEELSTRAPSALADLEAHNAFYVERVTEAWYLRTIVMEADIAERAIAEGRPWEAVASAIAMGELLTELRMKLLWEPAAIAGSKSLRGSTEGAQAKRAASRPRHEAIRGEYARRHAENPDNAGLKPALAKKHGISRRQLNRIISED